MAKLTFTQRLLMTPEQKTLIEADFMQPDGKLTDDAKYYLQYLLYVDKKDALLERAKQKIAEQEAEKNK